MRYLEQALKKAQYSQDEGGLIVARVPAASGFFAQGDNLEDARDNLRDVIEGNVLLALQLGLPIPHIQGVEIIEKRIAGTPGKHVKTHAAKTARNRS
jgi:predicted RNase H-like HicB family nuclease